ncbi:hypothetical protein AWB80_07570 [Caballeronia pedi]|uniref:Uncharacterized protein n=1 Tax=Caballeronia pedi TaxID=1777141 RepID=A0A158DWV0_9BURK|nr:hypothetical protein [Caballeronia pedi]SAK98686.1 hypothetical protein AWB80_07570 [Caballeronia pedi]
MEQDVTADAGGTSAVDAVSASPVVADVTLDEFCVRLSRSDRRVELIAAFHFTETSAGRFKDAESNYQSRFTAFVTKPV